MDKNTLFLYAVHMDNNSISVWLGREIKKQTSRKGKTDYYVAERASIPWTTYRRKLRGVNMFQFDELLRIAEVLEISPATITPPIFRQSEAA